MHLCIIVQFSLQSLAPETLGRCPKKSSDPLRSPTHFPTRTCMVQPKGYTMHYSCLSIAQLYLLRPPL